MTAHAPRTFHARWMLIASVVLAASTLVSCAGSPEATTEVDGGFVAGDGSILVLAEADRTTAPDLRGRTFDGEDFALSDQRGNVVVINVWASWCAPCRAEAPDLVAVAKEMASSNVTFVGLNIRDSDVPARAFVQKFDVPYPNIADVTGQLQLLFSESLPPAAIPSTLVIDPLGRVAARALGRVSASTLRGLITPLILPSVQ